MGGATDGLEWLAEQVGNRVRLALPSGVEFVLVIFHPDAPDVHVVNSASRSISAETLRVCVDYLEAYHDGQPTREH